MYLYLNIYLSDYHRHAFATLSFVAEIFIFLYVGMDALDIEKWRFVSDRYVQFSSQALVNSIEILGSVWFLFSRFCEGNSEIRKPGFIVFTVSLFPLQNLENVGNENKNQTNPSLLN